jgi:hypothetical protein
VTIALAILRWFGLKAGAFALCALLAITWGAWHRHTSASLAHALRLSQADVAVLEAQRDAANALADDYQARAERAVAAEAEAKTARAKAEKAAARRWAEIRAKEKAWATTPVPESVWEEIGK